MSKHKSPKVIIIEVPKFKNIDKKICKIAIPLILASNTIVPVHAAGLSEGLKPLLLLLQDLAEPVSYAYMIKGFMKLMSGDEHEGYKTIKFAASGYLGIQFIPQIFKILKTINLG